MNGREPRVGLAGVVALGGLLVVGTFVATADPFTLVFYLSYAAVGAYLLLRRPRNVIGWLLVGIGFGFIATTTSPDLDTAALLRGDATLRDTFTTWVNGWGGWASYVALLALTIVVPGGRLPQGRGRGVAIILLAVGVAVVVLSAVAPTTSVNTDGVTTIYVPNPVSVLPDLPFWSVLHVAEWSGLVIVSALAIGVVQMVLRYRASSGIERQQLRWLVAAVAFVLAAVMTGLVSLAIFGDAIGGAAWIPAIIAYPAIPLAIGVAVMRYRLFEIDRIISRTVSWAAISGILVAVFAGGLVAMQAVLASITQGQTLAVAGSTLAAFALFQPVRRRVQNTVDRRFDRARYDAQRTIELFAARLRGDIDLSTVSAEILGTATAAVRPSKASVWIRGASR
jgi:hypothetical protein